MEDSKSKKRKKNPPKNQLLFNSLKNVTYECLLEYLNSMNSSKREKLIWEINKELKLGWGGVGKGEATNTSVP